MPNPDPQTRLRHVNPTCHCLTPHQITHTPHNTHASMHTNTTHARTSHHTAHTTYARIHARKVHSHGTRAPGRLLSSSLPIRRPPPHPLLFPHISSASCSAARLLSPPGHGSPTGGSGAAVVEVGGGRCTAAQEVGGRRRGGAGGRGRAVRRRWRSRAVGVGGRSHGRERRQKDRDVSDRSSPIRRLSVPRRVRLTRSSF